MRVMNLVNDFCDARNKAQHFRRPQPCAFVRLVRDARILRARRDGATCHSGAEFTDANVRLHPRTDVVSEPEPNGAPSWASRNAPKQYRTARLQGVWQHATYFHNGTAPTLEAVVRTYDTRKSPGLTET